MRKALTLRAVPAALGIAILGAAPAVAQDSGPASPQSEVPPPPGPTPSPDSKPYGNDPRPTDPGAPGDTTPSTPPAGDPATPPPAPGDGASPPTGDTTTASPSSTGTDSGAAAQPTATIIDIAVANAAFSTLTKAVQAADLAGPLGGTGPFTIFAPTNDAFAKLPDGTLDTLTKPENKAALTSLLSYHVVSGAVTSADIAKQIQAGGGKATLTTVSGGTLTASMDGNDVVLTDAKGGKSRVVVTDVKASNGIVHAVDTVVMP